GVGAQKHDAGGFACTLVDRSGRETMPARYFHIGPLTSGVAPVDVYVLRTGCVSAYGKYGLVDVHGRELIAPQHCRVDPPQDGLVRVVLAEKDLDDYRFGFADLTGRMVVPELPYQWSD